MEEPVTGRQPASSYLLKQTKIFMGTMAVMSLFSSVKNLAAFHTALIPSSIANSTLVIFRIHIGI